jgi:hypothetical protein
MAAKPSRDRRHAARVAALAELYAELPAIECRGLCWDSCSRIPILPVERRHVAAVTGVDIPDGTRAGGPSLCPALTMLGRCGVHEVRPMICRLWGIVDNMPCTFGCVPDGGRLSVADGYEMLARAAEIGGAPDVAREIRHNFATVESAELATRAAMELLDDQIMTHTLRVIRATADGSARWARPGGRLARTADRPDR